MHAFGGDVRVVVDQRVANPCRRAQRGRELRVEHAVLAEDDDDDVGIGVGLVEAGIGDDVVAGAQRRLDRQLQEPLGAAVVAWVVGELVRRGQRQRLRRRAARSWPADGTGRVPVGGGRSGRPTATPAARLRPRVSPGASGEAEWNGCARSSRSAAGPGSNSIGSMRSRERGRAHGLVHGRRGSRRGRLSPQDHRRASSPGSA